MAYKDKLPILKNFVEMGITQDVSSVDTTIYVTNASLFPAVVPGADYIPCVIRWSGSTREVVHVVAVNTAANTITVERGKEGTTAQSWPSGSFLYATLTAQAQTDILNNIWIRCRQSNGNAVAVTVESATSFSLPGDWRDSLEPMMALRILANGSFLSTENGIYIDSVSYTASTGKTLVSIRGASLPAKVAAIEHSLSSRAVSQSKEVQEYRNIVERVSANLNASEKTCIENADRAQAAAAKLTFSSAINSTKEDCAATPLAVKKAYDRGSAGITAANNALSEAGKKLPLSGGTLMGNVLFPVNENEADVKTLRLGVRAADTDGTARTFFPFRIIPGSTTGRGLVLCPAGPLILGGGESAQTFAKGHIGAGKLNGETEYTFITSDNGIEFYYGQNAGYNAAKKIVISAAGDMAMAGRIAGLRGIPQSDASIRYAHAALEIRENGGVGNTQSDVGYAPTLGFHWNGVCAGTLALQHDGTFAFLTQNGHVATLGCHATDAGRLNGKTEGSLSVNYANSAGNAYRLGNIKFATPHNRSFAFPSGGTYVAIGRYESFAVGIWGPTAGGTQTDAGNPIASVIFIPV